MGTKRLTPETFLAVAEMICAHLRVKEADRWSPHVCRLKFHSFTSEFPEVSETQFMWAAEAWIQNLPPGGFTRFPTWRELMAPLYRSENGLANRSWGFREVGHGPGQIPPFCAPTTEQIEALPKTPQPLLQAPISQNAAAYVQFVASDRPRLPPASDQPVLTEEQWQAYLQSLRDGAADQQGETAEDPGERTAERQMVGAAVQQARPRADSAELRVSRGKRAVH